jgi:hypothetical protein
VATSLSPLIQRPQLYIAHAAILHFSPVPSPQVCPFCHFVISCSRLERSLENAPKGPALSDQIFLSFSLFYGWSTNNMQITTLFFGMVLLFISLKKKRLVMYMLMLQN